MQKITPFLWYDHEAKEAADFYVSVFSEKYPQNSKLGNVSYYTKASEQVSGKPAGSILTVNFTLAGQQFTAINGGPPFKLSEAVSFAVTCESQKEVDYYWNKLTEGGDEKAQICGWLKDKFGLSWQVVPTVLEVYLRDSDPAKAERVMEAMLKMKKIIIEDLEKAYV